MLSSTTAAWASLGQHEGSAESDRIALHGKRTVSQDASYRVHEITTDTRQTVREYVTASGQIFAVTWRGARQPDLEQLFGEYYAEYLEAERATPVPAGRAPKVTSSINVTVFKMGHMGDVHGKAVLPRFLPDGVQVRDLR